MLFYLNGFFFLCIQVYKRKRTTHPFPHVAHRIVYHTEEFCNKQQMEEEEEKPKMSIEKIISFRNQLIRKIVRSQGNWAGFFTFS